MKITIDKEDGSVPFVMIGAVADNFASGVAKIWSVHQIKDRMIKRDFDKLLEALRAPEPERAKT